MNYGLEFVYKNHKLGKSRLLEEAELDLMNLSYANSDMIFVKCGNCNGQYMVHEDTGHYICPKCKSRLFFQTAYNKLEKENERWLNTINRIDVPVGCAACGGPYPDCITGCKLCDE